MSVDASIRSEVLDAIANGIFVVDADGHIVVWNHWMAQYSGISADAALGRLVGEVFPDVVGTRFESALQQALSHRLAGLLSPSIHHAILPLFRHPEDRTRNERIQQLINLTPVRVDQMSVCVIQIQDVTAAILRERRLREQADELGRSNAALQARLDEIQSLQQRLIEMQHRDALTDLYNRAYLNDTLERELSAARHAGKPLSVVLIDIDNLKKINDTYGQQAGDELIKAMGGQLAQMTQPPFCACRFGGDELMVIMPGLGVAEASRLAEEWRQQFEQSSHRFGNFELKATVSAGVAGYPLHGKTAEELSQSADLACYLAKHDGHNRIVVFDAGNGDSAA